jgi:HAMP domain-containing protein
MSPCFVKATPLPTQQSENCAAVTLFSPGEFHRKLASADHFLSSVMNAKTIPLKGSVTIATATEADEIVFLAKSFLKMVEEWIETTHPMMKG